MTDYIQAYDKITLDISLVGVMTTFMTTTGVDTDVSLVKTAYKAGEISKHLLKKITGAAAEIVDAALKGVFSNILASNPSVKRRVSIYGAS